MTLSYVPGCSSLYVLVGAHAYRPRIYVCIHPTSLPWARCDTISFLNGEILVWIQSFNSPGQNVLQILKNILCPIYPYLEQGGNIWNHIFLKGICDVWKANRLVQLLNSCHQSHFVRQYPIRNLGLQYGKAALLIECKRVRIKKITLDNNERKGKIYIFLENLGTLKHNINPETLQLREP